MSFWTSMAEGMAIFGLSKVCTIGGTTGSFSIMGSFPLLASMMLRSPPPPPPPILLSCLGCVVVSYVDGGGDQGLVDGVNDLLADEEEHDEQDGEIDGGGDADGDRDWL